MNGWPYAYQLNYPQLNIGGSDGVEWLRTQTSKHSRPLQEGITAARRSLSAPDPDQGGGRFHSVPGSGASSRSATSSTSPEKTSTSGLSMPMTAGPGRTWRLVSTTAVRRDGSGDCSSTSTDIHLVRAALILTVSGRMWLTKKINRANIAVKQATDTRPTTQYCMRPTRSLPRSVRERCLRGSYSAHARTPCSDRIITRSDRHAPAS
jgi:hypothetical protein